MAKKSAVEKNKNRQKLVDKYADKRAALRSVVRDRDADPEERFEATLALAALPRNGAKTRLRNRCGLTGRPRGYYRKFGLSRIAVRELGSIGQIPGLVKSSW
ncbi:MAG: 30S ribosomal protein S14 [Alphaproteobacteria bacterium]|nr:30S ribosomal protein S14 [Alphaproteobacteria bacterium]